LINLFLARPLVLRPLLGSLGGVIRVALVTDALLLLFTRFLLLWLLELWCTLWGLLPSTFQFLLVFDLFALLLVFFLFLVLSQHFSFENILVLFKKGLVFLLCLKGKFVLAEECLKLVSVLTNQGQFSLPPCLFYQKRICSQ